MPSVDSARRRARLTGTQLEVLVDLVEGRPSRPQLASAATALTDAGLLLDGRPVAALVDLVRDLAAADVTLDLEVAGRDGVSVHGAALTAERCWLVSGWPGVAESEYTRIDPRMLLPALSMAVGLQQGAPPPGRTPVSCSLADLGAALDARGTIEAAAAPGADLGPGRATTAESLRSHGVAPELAAVLADERSAWRLTSSWTSDSGRVARVLAVVDAGEQGLWRREGVAEPLGAEPLSPGTTITWVPIAAADVWRDLISLLPAGPERRG